MALAHQAGNELQAMDALVLLARTAADEGDYDLAVRLHQQTAAFCRQLNYTAGTTRALTNLGNTHILRGDYATAQPLLSRWTQTFAYPTLSEKRLYILYQNG